MYLFNHIITLLFALAASANCEVYTIRPSLPGHPLDGQAINAQGRAFYTGLSGPSTYCPTVVEPNCPKNPQSRTLFSGLVGLPVMVPGGQQVYVGPDGAVGFTQAHSASIPMGSYQSGWLKFNLNSLPSRHLITWEAPDKSTCGVYACLSSPATATKRASYQIYAKTPAFNQTDCVKLDGLDPAYLPDNTPIAVWQYI